MQIKPNLFIVGAPKCGTTALAAYLKTHPDIFMCEPKEPHHFCDDLPGHRVAKSEADYAALFADAQGKKVVGEASVWYLFSRVAIERIRAFNPDARIVVMLRHPVDMVYSLHSQLIYSKDEHVEDFAKAWGMQAERAAGRGIVRICRDPVLLQYRQVATFSDQIERLCRVFPSEQIKVLLFDDFRADTRKVYEEVLQFLGIDSDGRTEFEVINSNHVHRLDGLATVLRTKPPLLRSTWRLIKRIAGLNEMHGQRIFDRLRAVNTAYRARPPMPAALRRQLIHEFRDEVGRLEALLGRDLSSWRSLPGERG